MLHTRIKEIRKAKGLTLQDVAARIKPTPTTPQTIGRLENGKRTLSTVWIERIAEALECQPSDLLALPEAGDLLITGKTTGAGTITAGDSKSGQCSATDFLCTYAGPRTLRPDQSHRAGRRRSHSGAHTGAVRAAGPGSYRLHRVAAQADERGVPMNAVTNKGIMGVAGLALGLLIGWASRPAVMLGQKLTFDLYMEGLGSNSPLDASLIATTSEHLIIWAVVGIAFGLIGATVAKHFLNPNPQPE